MNAASPNLSPARLSENAQRILDRRYLRKNDTGNIIETPSQMFRRVARAIAKAEALWGTNLEEKEWEEKFFDVMSSLKFLPNSPTLMSAGTTAGQLSACFVLPIADHLEDIFTTLRLSALIQQSGGGTGFNFSHLRPRNDILVHSQGKASGPVSFIKIFDAATEHIKQGGKRRGANMGILNIDHPDIDDFIKCKRIEGNVRNFNISVGITDHFMETLNCDGTWDLIHPNTLHIVKTVKAKTLWNAIIEAAWQTGDPGLIFLDKINACNPTPNLGQIEATNPCGEVPLLPYESCNLGSVNLSRFVIKNGSGKLSLDFETLRETVAIAIRFLDNVIDVNHYLSSNIKEKVRENRKIGLGVMGWGETLCKLEIPYESHTAVQLAENVMCFIARSARITSMDLAKQRGTFKNWKQSIHYPNTPIRNATCTSIAPTGSISIIADTSSSIEPFFALAYQRRHILQDETLHETNKELLRYIDHHHLDASKILPLIRQTGTLKDATSVPEHVKSLFRTALEIDPSWHLKHQQAFQKYTDNAVSKTINLPADATPGDIDIIYRTAWNMGLKGITIFRNNSKRDQALKTGITSDMQGCKVCIE